MGSKEIHYCQLCGLDEIVNKKKPHHIMPRRFSDKNHRRIWLCRFCHMILHKAEFMGLCKLPQDEEEYLRWKEHMKLVSNGTTKWDYPIPTTDWEIDDEIDAFDGTEVKT